jgi:hypothetical protein
MPPLPLLPSNNTSCSAVCTATETFARSCSRACTTANVSWLVTTVPPVEAPFHSEGSAAALASPPARTEAKETNGNAVGSGAAQACTLHATACERAEEALHRA